MSADSKNETPESKVDPIASIKTEIDSKLAEVKAQIEAMNSSFAEGMSALTSTLKPQKNVEVTDDDVFSPRELKDKILSQAAEMSQQMLNEERKKNSTIYQMAQEYPEIQTDRELQNEILKAQKSLPKSLQDTAEGYEMAVLKAVARQGVLPKSKRPVAGVDDDISVGSSRSPGEGRKTSGKVKVDEKTIAFAELLRGRELTDEEVKGLESATKRDSYSRYR